MRVDDGRAIWPEPVPLPRALASRGTSRCRCLPQGRSSKSQGTHIFLLSLFYDAVVLWSARMWFLVYSGSASAYAQTHARAHTLSHSHTHTRMGLA